MSTFTIIGHRGACAQEPENTLRSIRRAITDGADMVEIDVRWAAGELLVIHDDTLDRTTNGSGQIGSWSFDELRQLDAGAGEPIPTLKEVMDVTLPALPLNIEIKEVAAAEPVCELLLGLPQLDPQRVLVSSFHEDAIRQVRERLPNIPIGILANHDSASISGMIPLAIELGAITAHPAVESVSAEMVAEAHDSNLRVLPYTVRTREQLEHVLRCDADGCFADDPKWADGVATART
ncbi:MAG: glycerophosphodiester phosphodiesterase [Verrucomicrobiales bacterium]